MQAATVKGEGGRFEGCASFLTLVIYMEDLWINGIAKVGFRASSVIEY